MFGKECKKRETEGKAVKMDMLKRQERGEKKEEGITEGELEERERAETKGRSNSRGENWQAQERVKGWNRVMLERNSEVNKLRG